VNRKGLTRREIVDESGATEAETFESVQAQAETAEIEHIFQGIAGCDEG
jgi:hypothetical protein